jgi:sec-independent protein translocase protein TatB
MPPLVRTIKVGSQLQSVCKLSFVSVAHGQVSWSFMVITPPIQVANIGIADSVLLMVLALVVFGPRKLPEIGRKIGKLMYEFRKASNDFKFQMEEELRNTEEAEKRKAQEAQQAEDHKKLMELVEDARKKDEEASAGGGTAPSASTPAPATEVVTAASELSSDAEVSSEDSYLRIQPPSTGEPVPAARPGSVADAANAMADLDAAENSVKKDADPDSNAKGTEPEVNHG